MKSSLKKALIISTPFSVLIFSVLVVSFLFHDYSNPLDEDWITRQFLLGMFMFTGLTIIPRLLHLQLIFSRGRPSCSMNLSHHPPSIRHTHEFQIRDYSICSGCFGSFLGIIISEFIFLGYFLNPHIFFVCLATQYFLIGLILIILSYSRYLISVKPNIRLIQHLALFIGLVLALIACDLTFKSAFAMILLLPSWLLFLIGRVQLGKLDHLKF